MQKEIVCMLRVNYAFLEGQWRVSNPYAAISTTLEQVWTNGWDHGRRIKKREDRR